MSSIYVCFAAMAKSKSERMKAYRAKKKAQLGDGWLLQERQRVKQYYKRTEDLNRVQKQQRREKVRQQVCRHRQKQKDSVEVETQGSFSASITEDEHGVSSTMSSTPVTRSKLIVKLPSTSRANTMKKRNAKALAKAYRKIKSLEEKNISLKKKLNAQAQRRSREKKKKSLTSTPTGKIASLMRSAGISPRKSETIRQKLLFAECMTSEIQQSMQSNPEKSNVISKIVSGKTIKKYRLLNTLQKSSGISKRQLRRSAKLGETKTINMIKKFAKYRQTRAQCLKQKTATDISDFMERDDNSRMLPGKADAGKDNIQKRVLNDYLHNLHVKFQAESSYRVSLATFCKCRPKHINLVNFASRLSCLCQKHQNFALKLRCMKALGLDTCTSPDKFVEINRENGIDHLLSGMLDDKIEFSEWKRVKCQDGKERMKIVKVEVSKYDFKQTVKDQFEQFIEHVDRVKVQYSAIRTMKETLPKSHAIIQMDFAENYTCQTREDVMSAYWNQTSVTLHPAIVYYKSPEGTLQHLSHVYVSDVLHHNSAMVLAVLQKLLPSVKTVLPDLTHVHIWTDSPTSQYRNRVIFDTVDQLHDQFGLTASWHYFECGHGKGPCDGVGGTTKRNADNAVKQGKAEIQDATDFFAWACSETNSQINYTYITNDEYSEKKAYVDERNKDVKPIKGTMKLHAVASSELRRQIITRTTTCVCSQCFTENGFNFNSSCGWRKQNLLRDQDGKTVNEIQPLIDEQRRQIIELRAQKKKSKVVNQNIQNVATGNVQSEVQCSDINFVKPGDFVQAVYENRVYVGKALDVRNDEITITFMEECGKVEGCYKWPSPPDELKIPVSDIVKTINEPVPTGKSKRFFKIQ